MERADVVVLGLGPGGEPGVLSVLTLAVPAEVPLDSLRRMIDAYHLAPGGGGRAR